MEGGAHEYPPEDQGAAPGADAAAQRRVQRFEWPQPAATDPNERPTSVALVKVWPDSLTLPVGAGWRLVAMLLDSSGNPVTAMLPATWTSSSPVVAAVDTSGLVTMIAQGTARITATSGGHSGTAAIVSLEPVTLTIRPSSATLPVGDTLRLTVTGRDRSGNVVRNVPQAGRAVEWGESSSCHTISIASWDTVLVKATVRGCDRSSHVHGPGRQTGWRSRRNHHGPRARCRGVARGPPGERQGCGRRRRVAPGDHHGRRGQPPLLSPCHLDHERSECSAGRHDGTLRDRGALCRPILSHCRPAEGPPRFTIGSMASLMPGRSRGPRLGLP